MTASATASATRPLDTYGTLYFGKSSFTYVSINGNPVVAIGVPAALPGSISLNSYLDTRKLQGYAGISTEFTSKSSQGQKNVFIVPDVATSGRKFVVQTAPDAAALSKGGVHLTAPGRINPL